MRSICKKIKVKMKYLKAFLIVAALCGASVCVADDNPSEIFQQKNTKRETRLEIKAAQAAAISNMVDSVLNAKTFTFVAERAVTSLTNNPYITISGYSSFTVKRDAVDSNLPFYGNMYQAPINATQGPLNFTSTDFTYEQNGIAKGKDKAYVKMDISAQGIRYRIAIEVFDTGTAVLAVLMDNGSSSTFYGYIEPNKTNK